ncbi:ABC transporter ATP-binding protein [Clostridium frigidicarnis]|uniref:ATP-binding cassette, subfamily B n=1 Tax=Clostridium frigidicarnis TaxID=84698 RepID=A0A1I0XQK6_9CLOT|nr:ABC transporter ATP-binding protein [Clostridium frigidicarnis]SFB03262.1 ATP-binding cassette, subfamily B [Clostridium frigidicarnis]
MQQKKKSSLRKLLEYIERFKGTLFFICILVFLYVVSKLVGPFLMGYTIDKYITNNDLIGLKKILIILGTIFFLTSFFNWFQNFLMIRIGSYSIKNLRIDLFSKMQSLSLRFFDTHSHGELMSRFTNDIDNINTTLNQSILEFIANILSLIGVLIFMIILNFKLALVTIVSTPLIIIITLYIARTTKKNFALQQERLGALNGYIDENISGQKVIKAYGVEDETLEEFKKANNSLKEVSVKAQIYSGIMGPIMNGISNINLALIVGVGAYLTLNGKASVGIIVSFINFARQFFQPLNQIANLYNQLQLAVSGADRVFEIMDEEAEIVNKQGAKDIKTLDGDVKFSRVFFGYDKGRMVLKDINIHAKTGNMVALIGPTGSGKSTIMNLLTRFYDINSGSINLDDIEIQDITMESLRKCIGIVLQDTLFFTGTVAENVSYGKSDATMDEIINACKVANVHDAIEKLPDKYNTIINTDTGHLSIGQKQLIAIARTVIMDPDILILDEATSNIDTRTEAKIQEAMNKIMEGRTSFVIAHRLKTILNADKIIVLKDGEVREEGTHKELLAINGIYSELYNNQFRLKA